MSKKEKIRGTALLILWTFRAVWLALALSGGYLIYRGAGLACTVGVVLLLLANNMDFLFQNNRRIRGQR